eukprot:TRINITY_DN3728_c0_g1_i1.p1 TRINITY_DN3728_c0_g1~~TRINITY_DN3728_c0_g1_i1.p1  ORF type:complete len:616 (+),score=92.23 TRINITY_DN3728_c0_g1_i1:79-1848(+)
MTNFAPPNDVRYFVIRAPLCNLEKSITNGLWATSQQHQSKLVQAFRCSKVILVFSGIRSGHFQGYGRMLSVPVAMPTQIWEHDAWTPLGGSFRVEWLCLLFKQRMEAGMPLPEVEFGGIPFSHLDHVKNYWKEEQRLGRSRDCDELPPEVGVQLCQLLEREKEINSVPDDLLETWFNALTEESHLPAGALPYPEVPLPSSKEDICDRHYFSNCELNVQCPRAHNLSQLRRRRRWAFFLGETVTPKQAINAFAQWNVDGNFKFYIFPKFGVLVRFKTVEHCLQALQKISNSNNTLEDFSLELDQQLYFYGHGGVAPSLPKLPSGLASPEASAESYGDEDFAAALQAEQAPIPEIGAVEPAKTVESQSQIPLPPSPLDSGKEAAALLQNPAAFQSVIDDLARGSNDPGRNDLLEMAAKLLQQLVLSVNPPAPAAPAALAPAPAPVVPTPTALSAAGAHKKDICVAHFFGRCTTVACSNAHTFAELKDIDCWAVFTVGTRDLLGDVLAGFVKPGFKMYFFPGEGPLVRFASCADMTAACTKFEGTVYKPQAFMMFTTQELDSALRRVVGRVAQITNVLVETGDDENTPFQLA